MRLAKRRLAASEEDSVLRTAQAEGTLSAKAAWDNLSICNNPAADARTKRSKHNILIALCTAAPHLAKRRYIRVITRFLEVILEKALR